MWMIGVPQAPLEIGVWPRKPERVQSGASGVKISSMRKSKMAAIWKARGNDGSKRSFSMEMMV